MLAGLVVLGGGFLGVFARAPDRGYLFALLGCLLPAALLVGARPRARRPVATTLLVLGVVVLGTALLRGTAGYSQNLSLATLSPWNLLAFGNALIPFPLAIALLSAGVGLLVGRRWALVLGLVLTAGVTGWFAVNALAGPVSRADSSGFWLDTPALATAGIYGAVALVLLAFAVGACWAFGELPAAAPRQRTRAWGIAIAVAAVALAAGGGWWFQFAPRLVLDEVFSDPALARCVGGELGKQDTGDTVSRADLGTVLSLTCNGDQNAAGDEAAPPQAPDAFRMHSLTGVDRLPNLASVDLRGNRITDLTPLHGLPKLARVTLTGNSVADLAPLASLPLLTDLGLSNNRVSDLRPLAGASHLRLLGLAGNRITDVSPLARLTSLAALDLSRNAITDAGALGGLGGLDRLQLVDNRITDVTAIGRLTALTRLDISGNRVVEVAGLSGCTSLRELWTGRNPLTDVSPLVALPALTGVDLEGIDSTVPGVPQLRARGVYVGGFA